MLENGDRERLEVIVLHFQAGRQQLIHPLVLPFNVIYHLFLSCCFQKRTKVVAFRLRAFIR